MELPTSFLISPEVPQRFNILFYDTKLAEEIKPLFTEYISEWVQYVDELNKIRSSISPNTINHQEIAIKQFDKIEVFRKCKVSVDTYTGLDRKCYWEDGFYELELFVFTSKPDKVFSKKYNFEITKEDAKYLKLNVITMLEEPIRVYLNMRRNLYYYTQAHYFKKPV